MVESQTIEALRDQPETIGRSYCEAQNCGDVTSMAELYAEDAVLLWPGGPPVRGLSNIKILFRSDSNWV